MRVLTAAVLLAALARPGLAASVGTSPFAFMSLDAGARPAAMAGAYTALATDANALLYNPGALGRVENTEATFMHDSSFQDVNQEYVGFASRSGFGFNLDYLDFGTVPR